MKLLLKKLSTQQHITELDLSNNDIGIIIIVIIIVTNIIIIIITVIDHETADALFRLVSDLKCPLKVLKLSNADVDDDEVIKFMDAFILNNSITHIDLSHNLMVDKQFTAHMDLNQILHLDFHGSGGVAIGSSLYVNSTLEILDISWNKLGPMTAAHISRALTTTATVIELNLAYNSIKDVGAESIGLMLFKNHKIKKINISNNNITAKGCFILAGALRKNCVLEELVIDGNPIGYVGGEYLLATFNFHNLNRVISMKECLFSGILIIIT
jgi:hypothetical protein